jgi:hypothetical protein
MNADESESEADQLNSPYNHFAPTPRKTPSSIVSYF